MADKDSLIQYVAAKMGPEQLQRIVDQVENELANDPDITPESIEALLEQLSFVAENPDSYSQVMQSLMQEGVVDPGDAPEQFDPMFIAVMILALTELLQRNSAPQAFARGGLAQAAQRVAAAGRNGDTQLAHVNPREMAMLKRMGGSGRINPQTGLLEFGLFKKIKKAFKKVFKAVAPIIKTALPAIATAFGGPWAGAATGAILGATGGGGLKGALTGGLSAALMPGGFAGDFAKSVGSNILGSSVGGLLANVVSPETLGAGVLGAGVGALTGGVKGAIQGGLSTGLGASAAGGINKAIGGFGQTGVYQATGGNLGETAKALFSGNPLKGAAPGVQLPTPQVPGTEALPSLSIAPEAAAGPGIQFGAGAPGITKEALAGAFTPQASASPYANMLKAFTPDSGTLLRGGLMLGSLAGQTPQMALQNIQNSALTEQQKADMARALTNYTASWNANTLPAEGTPEYADMMNKISQGIGIDFMNPTVTTQPEPQAQMARGGALSKIALLASGSGDGRDDTINAKLSDGEYVIDAETVALLGNGSTKAGAAALDQMRKQIRQQKGKMLAKGKFSPNAKSPLAYMKGGLR